MKKRILTFLFAVIAFFGIANAETWTETYKGTVGPYPVTARFTVHEETSMMGSVMEYNGSYTYTKAGNTLYLDGHASGYTDWKILLTETTPKGRESAHWELTHNGDNELIGTMRVTKTGKAFRVKLKRTRR